MGNSVGILTLSASDNCGSLLQAYALQRVLEERFHMDARILQFDSPASQALYSIFPPNCLKHPKKLIRGMLFYSVLKKQKDDYNGFRKKYLKLTEKHYFGQQELQEADGQFDYIVTGSDQVFNIRMPDFDESFLLDWVRRSEKIAYAPSLGGCSFADYPDPEALRANFKTYKALSTREPNGQKAIFDVIGRNVPILADPTLLLSGQAWSELAGERMVKEKYIFYYSWAYDNEKLNRVVEDYARAHGLQVYVINASKWLRRGPGKFGFRLFSSGGPQAFLNLMKYADKVFVESFHGVIFANKFQRDFFFLNDREDGSLDPRLNAILTLWDRKDRIVHNVSDIRDTPIDYSVENPALEDLIQQSFSYIEEAFTPVKALT